MDELNYETYILPPRLINGIPKIFWSVYQENIRLFISKFDLKPFLTPEQMLRQDLEPKIDMGIPPQMRPPKPFPGGDRGPHLHYKGQLYRLTNKQWNAFSKPILAEMSKKLAEAATVQFEQFIEITDTINTMGELFK